MPNFNFSTGSVFLITKKGVITVSNLLYENSFTHFAPAIRLDKDGALEQSRFVQKLTVIQNILESASVVAILNELRQILYCNEAFLNFTNTTDLEQIIGARPGEIFNCIHASENASGCGTSESCKTCGAALAIISSQHGKKCTEECRITIKQGEYTAALDLLVNTLPFSLEGQNYTIAFLTDISHEKRRKALEKIFFHDIINTAGSLQGYIKLLEIADDPAEHKKLFKGLTDAANWLVEEIMSQRDLLRAENNELTATFTAIDSNTIITNIIQQYLRHSVIRKVEIKADKNMENISFTSDPVLLKRVLGNMVKNALEASTAGDIVTLGANQREDKIQFWVKSPTVMPREVQLQIFQRYFSTKGSGRGLGTYSMKILSERYLKGNVTFSVSEEHGTIFIASYPLHI